MNRAAWLESGAFACGAACVALLIAVSGWWLLQDIRTHGSGTSIAGTHVSSAAATLVQGPDEAGATALQESQAQLLRLADQHLMGQEPQAVAPPPPPPSRTPAPAPPPRLDINLLGVMQSAPHPAAMLRVNGETRIYRQADTLPDGATLRSIHADRVVIERRTGTETVRLQRRIPRVQSVPLPSG